MKKISLILSLLLTFAVIPQSCSYDDSDLWSAVGDLDDRIGALEEAVKNLTGQTAALQQLLDKKLFIESVEETDEGQIVHFISAAGEMSQIVIKNGRDGKPGDAGAAALPPAIGVAIDNTGNYYWTINGEPLLDADGNRVPVNGTDGADGVDGKTPIFKVDDNGQWLISFDNGLTWTGPYGQATGADGDTFFTGVTVSPDGKTARIDLIDGSSVNVVIYKEFNIAFDIADMMVPSGRSVEIPYHVTGATPSTVVEAIGRDEWKADVISDNPAAGVIRVTAPTEYAGSGRVVVYASDGADITIMRTLTFVAGTISVSTSSVDIPQAGGTSDITVTTNVDFTASVEPEAASWLSLVEGRAYEMRTETIIISAAPNKTPYSRTGRIYLSNDGNVIETILVVQTPITFDRSKLVFVVDPSITGGKIVMPQLELAEGSLSIDWGDGSPLKTSDVSLTATDDLSHTYADTKQTYTVQITGKFKSLQIRGSAYANSYVNEGITDVVQWGTSPYTLIAAGIAGLKRVGAPEPESRATLTTISFQGCKDLEIIDPDFFSGLKNITSLNSAFRDCASLRTLPDGMFDDLTKVSNLYQLFRDCSSLENVPAFRNISSVDGTNLNTQYMFSGCASLKEIPKGYFSAYAKSKIKNIGSMFASCTALTTIPDDFFKGVVVDPTYGNANAVFMNCPNLESLDFEQFCNETAIKAYSWTNTFNGCKNLAGKVAPAKLTVGSTTYNVYPWERQSYLSNSDATVAAAAKALFGTRNVSGQNCFTGCVRLDGYATEIPTSWGGLWDGIDAEPTITVKANKVAGSEYYAIDFLVKGKNMKELKYLLGTEAEIESLLPQYNNDITKMVADKGVAIESEYLAAANSTGLTLPFTDAKANTSYRLVVAAFNSHGQATAQVIAKTDPCPKGSTAYESYIGRWRVTSAESTTEAQASTGPISFDITIEPYRVNESYMVGGWGTTIFRNLGKMRFMFENGKMNVYAGYAGPKSMWNTIASRYYRYTHEDYGTLMCDIGMFFYAELSDQTFSVVLATPTSPILTSTINGNTISMTGGSGSDLAIEGVNKVIGMDIFINTGGYGWSFTRRPLETVLDEYHITIGGQPYAKYAVGPYTLTRLGDLPASSPRRGFIRLTPKR